MKKVLIADASEQWREQLEQALREEYHVRTCCDGVQAVELIGDYEPDVLVMDLMLSGVDGLSVLKSLEGRPCRPRVIVTGRFLSNFITAFLGRHQVHHVLLKPCTVQCVLERVAEVATFQSGEQVFSPNPYDGVTTLLVTLGIPVRKQGFRFLRTGILLLLEDPCRQLTKELYPAIAREHNTSAVNVEKGIRTAVTAAWQGRRDEVWRDYFPMSSTGQIPKPTAGQFLQRLTDVMSSIIRNRV